jgi:hypothetical protein
VDWEHAYNVQGEISRYIRGHVAADVPLDWLQGLDKRLKECWLGHSGLFRCVRAGRVVLASPDSVLYHEALLSLFLACILMVSSNCSRSFASVKEPRGSDNTTSRMCYTGRKTITPSFVSRDFN